MRRRAFLTRTALTLAGIVMSPQQLTCPSVSITAEDVKRFYASINPFTDSGGHPLFPDTAADDQLLERVLDQILRNVRYKYGYERAVVDEHLGVRIRRLQEVDQLPCGYNSLHHPVLEDEAGRPLRLRTGELTEEERAFLKDKVYYGAELNNWRNRVRYDPMWRDVSHRQFPHLQPMDCTRYFLEEFVHLTGQDDLMRAYVQERTTRRRFPWFPWKFSMRMRHDFESLLIIPDTENDERYQNGSSHGWRNQDILEAIEQHEYYLDPQYAELPRRFREAYLEKHDVPTTGPTVDYYVLDDAVRNEEFKGLIERARGFATIKDFYHLLFLNEGELYDAKWGNNPLYANTFEKTVFTKRLVGEPPRERIPNMVVFLPRGTTARYINERLRHAEQQLVE
ncbi:hypothetical protein GF367_03715 [Candidatus Woesearchaeota archaeon]|nr:hypothetical protein [Candidatus Woesearchaeota archaeon]